MSDEITPVPCVCCGTMHYSWDEIQACVRENGRGVRPRPSAWTRFLWAATGILSGLLRALSPMALLRAVEAIREYPDTKRQLDSLLNLEHVQANAQGDVEVRYSGPPAEAVVRSLTDWFRNEGAGNNLTMRMWDRELGHMDMVLQRRSGLTPAEQREHAWALLSELATGQKGECDPDKCAQMIREKLARVE